MYQREALKKVTYRYDLIRGAFGGILEVGALSFGLLAAIRYFDAPDTVKGILSAGIAFGLFLAPFGQLAAARTRMPASRVGALCFFLAGLGYAIASQTESLWVFSLAFLGANSLLAQIPSLFVAVYAKNYSHHDRGRLVANTFIIAAIVGATLSFFGGEYLDVHREAFGTIFLLMAGASAICGLAVLGIPSEPIKIQNPNRWGNFSLIFEDKLFAKMLMGWMILGFANLSLLPLRVEILANPHYGFNLPNSQIIFITVVIFALARIVGLKVFGLIFERMNFLTYRILINGILFLAILFYFNFQSILAVGIGSALFGIGMGGGNLAWSLWVTRIAPDERVSEYMSVHMSLTGMRGILSPIIAYSLLPFLTPQTLSWFSFALLIYSGYLFFSLRRDPPIAARFAGRDQ